MNQEEEVRQMRRARDSPPPLPPGHPVMELYHPDGEESRGDLRQERRDSRHER